MSLGGWNNKIKAKKRHLFSWQPGGQFQRLEGPKTNCREQESRGSERVEATILVKMLAGKERKEVEPSLEGRTIKEYCSEVNGKPIISLHLGGARKKRISEMQNRKDTWYGQVPGGWETQEEMATAQEEKYFIHQDESKTVNSDYAEKMTRKKKALPWKLRLARQ